MVCSVPIMFPFVENIGSDDSSMQKQNRRFLQAEAPWNRSKNLMKESASSDGSFMVQNCRFLAVIRAVVPWNRSKNLMTTESTRA